MELTTHVNPIGSFEVGMALPTSPTKKKEPGLFGPESSLRKDANLSKTMSFGLGDALLRAVNHW